MPLHNPDERAAFMRRATPAERLFRLRGDIGLLRDQYALLRLAVANGDSALLDQTVDEIGRLLKNIQETM